VGAFGFGQVGLAAIGNSELARHRFLSTGSITARGPGNVASFEGSVLDL
jgi:hypothetical protein